MRTGLTTLGHGLVAAARALGVRHLLGKENTLDHLCQLVAEALAERLAVGLRTVFARHGRPLCVTQVGARTEFQFTPTPPRNGSEADRILNPALEQNIHLYLLNRGLVITPFHNMMLVCPDTTADDVDRLVAGMEAFVVDTIAP